LEPNREILGLGVKTELGILQQPAIGERQTTPAPARKYMTLHEAAEYSRLSEKTLRQAMKKGYLKFFQPVERRFLLHPWDLDAFIQRKKPASLWR
jgi:excisionase family DNA binding protein